VEYRCTGKPQASATIEVMAEALEAKATVGEASTEGFAVAM
jgi:hypothetical protein